jgi:hypothetical protein
LFIRRNRSRRRTASGYGKIPCGHRKASGSLKGVIESRYAGNRKARVTEKQAVIERKVIIESLGGFIESTMGIEVGGIYFGSSLMLEELELWAWREKICSPRGGSRASRGIFPLPRPDARCATSSP